MKEKVYDLVKKVPAGRVTTYKAIAEKLGCKCYRLIGQIMARNPYAPVVPCHRVVKSNGEVGGFNGNNYNIEKIELLKSEGVKIENGKVNDFEKLRFAFE